MEVQNPRRILFLSPSSLAASVLSVLKDLTGSAPTPRPIPQGSEQAHEPADFETTTRHPASSINTNTATTTATTIAGLTHSLAIKNAYYTATIPIWLDEITSTPQAVETWKGDFLSEEASEVVKAIGAWVVIVPLGQQEQHEQDGSEKQATGDMKSVESVKQMLSAVKEVVEGAYGGDGIWDGVLLALGVRSGVVGTSRMGESAAESSGVDEWDDLCMDYGFEFVDVGVPGSKNGVTQGGTGVEKTGIARVKEALEANEWEAEVDDEEVDELEFELGLVEGEEMSTRNFASDGFEMERQEMEREFAGFKMAMNTDDEDETFAEFEKDQANGVEELEKMMVKMQAVKDMSAHLPEQERKRLAAKTVREIMGST